MAAHPIRRDFSICTWNAQALFAKDAVRHSLKWGKLLRLLRDHDVVTITESHGTSDSLQLAQAPAGAAAWWAPGTSRRGGVGVVVKESFLQQFPNRDWTVLHPGRAAALRLGGPLGSMDIFVSYFQTGTPDDFAGPVVEHAEGSQMEVMDVVPLVHQRGQLRRTIARSTRPSHDALTIITGDFNRVAEERDRISKATGAATGKRDRAEEAHWTDLLPGFTEAHQPCMTHSCAQARSRLDRIYVNMEATDLLDRQVAIGVDDWNFQLSNHRAVFLARRAPPPRPSTARPISSELVRRPG